MKTKIIILTTFLFFSASFSHAQRVVRIKPNKPNVVVVKTKKPTSAHRWVEGHWKWSPRLRQYTWVKGYWIKPRVGYVWVDGHWKSKSRGFIWVDGRWKKRRVYA